MGNLVAIGNSEPCPVCGRVASVVDGTYDVRGGVLTRREVASVALEAQKLSTPALETLRDELASLPAEPTAEQVREALEGSSSALANVWRVLSSENAKTVAAYLSVLLAVISLVIALRNQSPHVTISTSQLQQVIEQSHPSQEVGSGTGPPRRPRVERDRPRNQKCHCGSGHKYKNCHGRTQS